MSCIRQLAKGYTQYLKFGFTGAKTSLCAEIVGGVCEAFGGEKPKEEYLGNGEYRTKYFGADKGFRSYIRNPLRCLLTLALVGFLAFLAVSALSASMAMPILIPLIAVAAIIVWLHINPIASIII